MFAFPQRARHGASRPGPSAAVATAEALEREADRTADRVPAIAAEPRRDLRASASGEAMDPRTRDSMQRRLGHDFTQVRIHTDDRAAEAARALSAHAFTYGGHVYFARDRYAPASSDGQRLLAHELAHVVQQRRLGEPAVQAKPASGGPAPAAPATGPVDDGPFGPISQAKAQVVAALDLTMARLQQAIEERDLGRAVPADVAAALRQYFPSFGDDLLNDIFVRIQPMSSAVPGIDAHEVPYPPPVSPPAPAVRDAALITGSFLAEPTLPAAALTRRKLGAKMEPGTDYIALFPEWSKDPALQATRLLHEMFHFLFDGMYHGPEPWNDAFAWQGFVSGVGGLPTSSKLHKAFPP